MNIAKQAASLARHFRHASKRTFFGGMMGSQQVKWSLMADSALTGKSVGSGMDWILMQATSEIADFDPEFRLHDFRAEADQTFRELTQQIKSGKPGKVNHLKHVKPLVDAFAKLDLGDVRARFDFAPADLRPPQILFINVEKDDDGKEAFGVIVTKHRIVGGKEEARRDANDLDPRDMSFASVLENVFEGEAADTQSRLFANMRLERQLGPTLDETWTVVRANYFF